MSDELGEGGLGDGTDALLKLNKIDLKKGIRNSNFHEENNGIVVLILGVCFIFGRPSPKGIRRRRPLITRRIKYGVPILLIHVNDNYCWMAWTMSPVTTGVRELWPTHYSREGSKESANSMPDVRTSQQDRITM